MGIPGQSNRTVRGKLAGVRQTVDINGFKARLPAAGVVLYVKGGSGKLIRSLLHVCKVNGCDVRPLESYRADDRPTAYSVVGDGRAVLDIVAHPAVESWHLIVNANVPRLARPDPIAPAAGGNPRAAASLAYERAGLRGRREIDERERRAAADAEELRALARWEERQRDNAIG